MKRDLNELHTATRHSHLTTFLVGLTIVALSYGEAQALLRNRFSFNEPVGPAIEGTIIQDSIGGQNGVVKGINATSTGLSLLIPGGTQDVGASTVPAYVDLPNGLISSLTTDATFECWYIQNSATGATSLFDFGDQFIGSGTYVELDGPIPAGRPPGAPAGDTIFFSPMSTTGPNTQVLRFENDNPVGGGTTSTGGVTLETNATSPVGVEHHVVVTIQKDADGPAIGTSPRITVFINGSQAGTVVPPPANAFQLENLNDVNNWLGRANYRVSPLFNGSFDEFRIYTHAFTAEETLASYLRGPNLVPEPITLASAVCGLLSVVLTARRRRALH